MASTTALTVDVSQLRDFATSLGRLDSASLGQTVVEALNDVGERTYALSIRRIGDGVNLRDEYLRRRMILEKATNSRPEVTITSPGGKAGTTQLSHYNSLQQVTDVNWSNSRIAGLRNFSGFSAWPGWTQRIGRSSMGIAPNKKAAGRSAEVTRGGRKGIRSAFSLPGKKDTEGNYLVFRRDTNGRIKSLLGPSVYQLFRYQIPRFSGQVETDLQTTLLDYAEATFRKVLE